ncbi:MAG: Fur family transcriptional regulator [Chloroflexota bacterium]|nr:Fur family transcriptional regulator [Chloroflexota bacterium]
MTEWEQSLTDAGCRITASRRAVMQVLAQADAPLSPYEIMRQAQAVHRKLGLVTVYRTLNLLAEMKLVRRIHLDDGCHGYLTASPGHRHALICQSCGRAVEFPGEDDLHTLIGRVEAGTGYRVDDHLLQLFGLCPSCQETEVCANG